MKEKNVHFGSGGKKLQGMGQFFAVATICIVFLSVTAIGQTPKDRYFFSEPSGSSSVLDSTGTTTGAITGSGVTRVTGKIGKGLSFSGANTNYVSFSSATKITGDWSVSVWVKRNANTANSVLIGGAGNAADTCIKLEQASSTYKVGITNNATNYTFSSNYITPLGTWVHLVFVKNSTNITLYVNGFSSGTVNTTIPLIPKVIGANRLYQNVMNATIDEFYVYNSALTSNQATALYQSYVQRQMTNNGLGTTTPSAIDTIRMGNATTISATPNTNCLFVNWIITNGTATITDPNSATTTVSISSNTATIQANFRNQNGTKYYLDPLSTGNNKGDTTNPWKVADSINLSTRTFYPGDTIFIKRNTIINGINGYISPHGSGTLGHPIVLTAYPSTGALPIIDASSVPCNKNGTSTGTWDTVANPANMFNNCGWNSTAAIYLDGQNYWTIKNMEVKNDILPLSTDTYQDTSFKAYLYSDKANRNKLMSSQAGRNGIYVNNASAGIYINHNIVSHIYGSYIRNWHDTTINGVKSHLLPSFMVASGIWVYGCKADNVHIDSNQIYDVVGYGINTGALANFQGDLWQSNHWDTTKLSTNFVIRGNYMKRTAGYGMNIHGTIDVLIEYNVIDSCGQLGWGGHINGGNDAVLSDTATFDGAGIQFAVVRNGIFQYNEISHMNVFACDGMAIDVDVGASGSPICQYNYIHDNNGAAFQEGNTNGSANATDPPVTTGTSAADDGDRFTGTIFRYNICQNNDLYRGQGLSNNNIYNEGPNFNWGVITPNRGNAQIYNNVFWASDTLAFNTNIGSTDWHGPNTYKNNIFFAPVCFFYFCNSLYNNFSNNCYTNGSNTQYDRIEGTRYEIDGYYVGLPASPASDPSPLTSNPQLLYPGGGLTGFNSTWAYKCYLSSPCIGVGVPNLPNSGTDFWGNTLSITSPTSTIGVSRGTPSNISPNDMETWTRITIMN